MVLLCCRVLLDFPSDFEYTASKERSSCLSQRFLVYNKQTDSWIEVKTYPEELKLMTSKNYLDGDRMRPLKVMETTMYSDNQTVSK
ncbi:unnamed protein product [Bursaphelenchus okinawaensis]|uniref:Uncharacterized protein n=1 Tax=Bursaphelenchus okinawaensis TaxID=465554 RepID=A0A811KEV9_9BILA|nr:unnamed protein product [Bursaphelenchus okinawaensis]CAG9100768.1 unnamed protein product [Bursaphelenchus okinawaensis]